jgi:hypothetical protein
MAVAAAPVQQPEAATQKQRTLQMTTRDEAFPSKYLKAGDLRGPVTVEIKDAPQESLTGFDGKQQTKTVL